MGLSENQVDIPEGNLIKNCGSHFSSYHTVVRSRLISSDQFGFNKLLTRADCGSTMAAPGSRIFWLNFCTMR